MMIIESKIIKPRFTNNLPKNRNLIHFSKKNRHAGILSEVLFWKQVHKGKFYGINFNRQKIIGNYIVDFYVPSLSLVIEIDGSSHDYKEEYDHKREDFFKSLGLNVFKVSDMAVRNNLSWVLDCLRDFIIQEYSV
ncbi:MAG: endonuclease domain-containing protein [Bacteroidetes bacterium]|nr:endonuclease domain-containing protein [Bacteroidota bacterium]MCL2303085.1 endonuclease domain-containing protein [Lentimicrobiaceae bacterium]